MQDYYDFIHNEKEKYGPTDERTLCNFFIYLKNQQFFAPTTMWCVYSTLNNHYQKLTGKKMRGLMVLSTIMRNTMKKYLTTQAKTFTKGQLQALLKNNGLLDGTDFVHLE